MTDLDAIATALLDAARRAGAEAADVVIARGEHLSAAARGGVLEEAERSESLDFGLRVLIGARQACVSASNPAPEVIAELAGRAAAMAREAPDDPYCGLAPRERLATEIRDLALADPTDAPTPAELLDWARECEDAALSIEGVTQAEGARATWGASDLVLAGSNGFHGRYDSTMYSLSVSAVAGAGLGMERDYDYAARRWRRDLPNPAAIGRGAGQRAVRRLNPRKAKTGAWPVIYDRRVAASLIGHLVGAANGAAIARGSSWLIGRMGEQVLPRGLSIIEDPHVLRGLGSRPFDGEGIATAPMRIVDRGRLATWLLDGATARKLGLESTGSAARGVSSPPTPSSSNAWLAPGRPAPGKLISEIGTGLLATEMIGSSINPNTGDYSRGVSGFWVENGEIAYPVNELTIAGNLPEMLATLAPADDLELDRRIAAPTVRVEGMTIAGA